MAENETQEQIAADEPKVSIIIPAAGACPWLGQTIGTGLPNVEIFIVDDGLDERSRKFAEEIQEKVNEVTLLDGDKRGQSSARNIGLKHATGKYVIFLDADDMIMNRMRGALEVAKSNDADVVHTVGHFIDVAETYVHLQGKTRVEPMKDFDIDKNLKLEGSPEDFLRFFLKDNATWGVGSKVFRREFLLENDIWFPENVNLGEGILFLLPCILLAKTYVITPDICYYYRQTDTGLTRKAYSAADMAHLLACQAEGLSVLGDFFAKYADKVHDPSLINAAKNYFLRPIETIIERISGNEPDMWGKLDDAARQVFHDRLLADDWWRGHIFGGYYHRTKEKEHLLLVQNALKEQLNAADALMDRRLDAPRVIVVASIYTLMLCTMLFRDWEKSIIICGGGIPKEVYANMQAMGLVCYAPDGGAFVSPRILETVARYAVRHNIPSFGNDDTPEATHFVKLNFTAVEDGTANYAYEHAIKRPEARRITPDGDMYVPFGFNDFVKKIMLTGKQEVPYQVADKVELFRPEELWHKKTPQEKERIYKLYSFPGKELKQMLKKGRDCLLITECYAMVGMGTEENEIAMYREILDEYGEEHFIIKPHHQERRDLAKLFPKAAVLPKFFPIDLMKYSGMKPRKVITPYSSAAFGLFPKDIVEIRQDLLEKYDIKRKDLVDMGDPMKNNDDAANGETSHG